MNSSAADRGIVLICDRDGIVQGVVRDDTGLSARIPAGAHIRDLMDADMHVKVGAFLAAMQTQQGAYNCELNLTMSGTQRPFQFAGAGFNANYLVKASPSENGPTEMNGELMRLYNEQTNVLRTTAKELAGALQKPPERDDAVYDELSRLNNEMANLQREMAKKNVELGKLDAQKNRLLGMAVHDLRSPLGVISIYAQFLEAETALSGEQHAFVTTIKEMSDFMVRLINDLLDVTIFESGQLKLARLPADLAAVISANVALNRVLAARKDIALEFDPPSAAPGLTFDALKIQQVLNNLIGNAIKFSHRGTRVKIRLYPDGAMMTVAVQDQGQGIPAEELHKLFLPFSKASVRSTAGEESTGLGLAIVRQIIEGHGGRIWVESVVGTGSTFFFTLPLPRG